MKIDSDYPRKDVVIEKNKQPEVVSLYKVPTESIELPSKGLVYPIGHPLRTGHLEIKYMTAREEDILTTESFIKDGTVLDRFLQSLIVTPGVDLDDLVLGDINALTIAARVHGYGPIYESKVTTPSEKTQSLSVDLTAIPLIYLEESSMTDKPNEFLFTLPFSKIDVTYKLLTQGDANRMEEALSKDKLKKEKSTILQKSSDKISTTQLKYQLVAVGGHRDTAVIYDFIDNGMLAADIRSLREHIKNTSPGVDLSVEVTDAETSASFLVDIAIGPQFFWPDAQI